jgi:predicted AlkP superfamily pyrophosphatase or phosphodiesterase
MRKVFLSVIILLHSSYVLAQTSIPRPKLVIGVVVDQMRWDYLYRYYDRYAETGGFKRFLKQGFSCENTNIPYAPTVTAAGHATIFTGSVPSIHGIVSNYWYDPYTDKDVYCTGDANVKTVGSSTSAGLQSPANLLTTTLGDELMLATNFRSKVVGIAIKDRGSILSAGHSATGAYWYDSKTGDWITSSHYANELPSWVKTFNAQKLADKVYKEGWNTLYPINTYVQSTPDENTFESKPFGADAKTFPYNFDRFVGTNYGVLPLLPQGNTFTLDFAKAAITSEQLGADAITDLLTVSLSTPDYVGHSFGPNSVEIEDIFLRLDKQLGEFFDYLDSKLGRNQYLMFLSADHGVAHVPSFLQQRKIAGGYVDVDKHIQGINDALRKEFRKDNLVLAIANNQVYLDLKTIQSSSMKMDEIKRVVINYLSAQPHIERVFDLEQSTATLNREQHQMFVNGYNAKRSGQLQIILQPQYLDGYSRGGSGHSAWNPYDSHIPLLWYGWGVKQGRSMRQVYMTDIAPTVSAMLRIQAPNGSVGKVITEVIKEDQ